jgi:integrase
MPTLIHRNGRWFARARVRGQRVQSRTFDSKPEARTWVLAKEAELRDSRASGADATTRTLGHIIKAYLDDETVQSQKSFSDTKRRIAWFYDHYAKTRIRSCGPQTWRAARKKLLAEKADDGKSRGNATANRYLSVMRACWNWARGADFIDPRHVWPPDLKLPEADGRTRYLSDGEFVALLKAAESDPVMRAAIVVSIASGLRQGELLRLTWADIDLVRGTAVARKTKSGKPRMVPILDAGIAALKPMRGTPAASVFTNQDGEPLRKGILEYRWKAIRKAAKLADFKWHDLRHTASSLRAQQGASDRELSSLLGHANAQMVQRYAHMRPGAEITGDKELNEKLMPKK